MFLYFQPEKLIFLATHPNHQLNQPVRRRRKDEPEERTQGWNEDRLGRTD
jgi:hypothetical protein